MFCIDVLNVVNGCFVKSVVNCMLVLEKKNSYLLILSYLIRDCHLANFSKNAVKSSLSASQLKT